MDEYDGRARHRKRAKKKTPAKADHRHEFVNCVYEIETIRLDEAHGFVPDSRLSIGTYCPVCGKIGTHSDEAWQEKELVPRWHGLYAAKWSERAKAEFDERTRTLPFFRIHDLFKQKFVE